MNLPYKDQADTHREFTLREDDVDRKDIEARIWGSSIAYAKARGIISEEEAEFLLDEYLNEYKKRNGWDGEECFVPPIF